MAGAGAAAVWAACDPLLKRVFGTPYADSEVAGPIVHVAAGAAFGHVFEQLGGRTVKHGVGAAVTENILLWPVLALAGRVHPKRRRGEWPSLLLNGRAFAAATTGHALFGALLGAAVKR